MKLKKLLIIIIVLAIILGIAFAVFFFLGERESSNEDADLNDPFPVGSGPGFGSVPGITPPSETSPEPDAVEVDANGVVIIPTLRKLFDEPTSGVYIYDTVREVESITYNEDGEDVLETLEVPETKFQIVERSNGHIYEFNSLDLLSEKLSNTTIVRVRDMLIGVGGYIYRYLAEYGDTIISFRASFEENDEVSVDNDSAQNPSILSGSFLPENILSMTLSDDKTAFAYLVSEGVTQSGLYVSPISIFSPQKIADLPISEIEILWPNQDTFMFYTKPDSQAPGNLFELNESGELRTLIADTYGLSATVSPSGEIAFVSFDTNEGTFTSSINLSTGAVTNTSDPLQTIAGEKCVWSNVDDNIIYCAGSTLLARENFPESWFKGSFFSIDTLWEIDVSTGNSQIVSNLTESGVTTSFDMMNLTVSPNDEYLLFINKYDRTPWVLDMRLL